MAGDPRILVAKIGAPHGVRGEVRVKCHLSDPAMLGVPGPLVNAQGREFIVEAARSQKSTLIVRFSGVANRDAAAALTGTKLYGDRAQYLEPAGEDEFYHADLIGMKAVDTGGDRLGTVLAIHNFGAGDILEIGSNRAQSMMIPFTKRSVPGINLENGHITVDPPGEVQGEPKLPDGEAQGDTS